MKMHCHVPAQNLANEFWERRCRAQSRNRSCKCRFQFRPVTFRKFAGLGKQVADLELRKPNKIALHLALQQFNVVRQAKWKPDGLDIFGIFNIVQDFVFGLRRLGPSVDKWNNVARFGLAPGCTDANLVSNGDRFNSLVVVITEFVATNEFL